MTGKRLTRRILAVGLMAAAFGVAEAQQVLEVDSTEIPPVANQAAVDATPCGFGRDLNENQTLINLELFSLHWCNSSSGTWEGVGSVEVGVPATLIPFGTGTGLDSDPGFLFTTSPGSLLKLDSSGGERQDLLLDIGNNIFGSSLTMQQQGGWHLNLQDNRLGDLWIIESETESRLEYNPFTGLFKLNLRKVAFSGTIRIAIDGKNGATMAYRFQAQGAAVWEIFYDDIQHTGSLGTPDNFGSYSIVLFEDGEVEIAGCTQYGPLSGALPVGGAQCDEFYDIDVNRWCVFTTSWVQQDDYSTACVA